MRRAELADLDALVASIAALFLEDAGRHDSTADLNWAAGPGRDWIAAGITDPRRLSLIGVDDDTVVGHLTGVLVDPAVMHMIVIADLRSLFVRPQYRRTGLGSELVRHFRTWAHEHNAARLSVTAYAANAAAIQFYQRHGFSPREVVLTASPAAG